MKEFLLPCFSSSYMRTFACHAKGLPIVKAQKTKVSISPYHAKNKVTIPATLFHSLSCYSKPIYPHLRQLCSNTLAYNPKQRNCGDLCHYLPPWQIGSLWHQDGVNSLGSTVQTFFAEVPGFGGLFLDYLRQRKSLHNPSLLFNKEGF